MAFEVLRTPQVLQELAGVIRPNGRGSWALADPLFSAYVRREISD